MSIEQRARCQVPGQLIRIMPPKHPFSAERAQEFGDIAVVKAIASFGQEGLPTGVVLNCTYRGIPTSDGGADHGGDIGAKSSLVYIWSVVGGGSGRWLSRVAPS